MHLTHSKDFAAAAAARDARWAVHIEQVRTAPRHGVPRAAAARGAVFQREARTKRLDQKFLAELTPHEKYDAGALEDAVHRLYNGPVEKREGRRRREDERLSEFDAHVNRYQKIAQAVRRGRAQQGVAGGEPLPLEGKAATFVERMYDGALEKRRVRHDVARASVYPRRVQFRARLCRCSALAHGLLPTDGC
jgi:hypothetical protein